MFCVILQTAFLYEKFNSLEKGRRHGRRLLPQKYVNGFGSSHAMLITPAEMIAAAVRVLTIDQTICVRQQSDLYHRSTTDEYYTMVFEGRRERLTFVVVPSVVAVLLEQNSTVFSIPAVVTLTLPSAAGIDSALPVTGTSCGASQQSTMFSVPPRHAETRPVLALSVFVAPARKSNNERVEIIGS